ncbi:ROK family transcriptional regulator [Phycicoccus ginsengisoli]
MTAGTDPTASRAPAATAGGRFDQGQMRRANTALILRHLRAHGGRSRARLATETGLSKATMSSLIGDLVDRGLVREGELERAGSVGRPGLTVSLDGRDVVGVGLEVNVDYVAATAVDLRGTVVHEQLLPLDVPRLEPGAALAAVVDVLAPLLTRLGGSGQVVVAVTIAAPGIIDYERGSVRFAPNLGWRDVVVVDALAGALGPAAPPVRIENDAKLAAVAEYHDLRDQQVEDLLFLTGDVGVGAGIVAGGHLVRGWSGFAGEVGHLPLDPEGRPCTCGRTGCWETAVGLAAFLGLAAPDGDPVHDPTLPLEHRLADLQARAAGGDRRVLAALDTVTERLATGLGILVDVLNPRVIVLGGYFAAFGDHILGPLGDALRARQMDRGSVVELRVSSLGFTSAARGGALDAVEQVFADYLVIPPRAPAG